MNMEQLSKGIDISITFWSQFNSYQRLSLFIYINSDIIFSISIINIEGNLKNDFKKRRIRKNNKRCNL